MSTIVTTAVPPTATPTLGSLLRTGGSAVVGAAVAIVIPAVARRLA